MTLLKITVDDVDKTVDNYSDNSVDNIGDIHTPKVDLPMMWISTDLPNR